MLSAKWEQMCCGNSLFFGKWNAANISDVRRSAKCVKVAHWGFWLLAFCHSSLVLTFWDDWLCVQQDACIGSGINKGGEAKNQVLRSLVNCKWTETDFFFFYLFLNCVFVTCCVYDLSFSCFSEKHFRSKMFIRKHRVAVSYMHTHIHTSLWVW